MPQIVYDRYVAANADRLVPGTWISIVNGVVEEFDEYVYAVEAHPKGDFFCREYRPSSLLEAMWIQPQLSA